MSFAPLLCMRRGRLGKCLESRTHRLERSQGPYLSSQQSLSMHWYSDLQNFYLISEFAATHVPALTAPSQDPAGQNCLNSLPQCLLPHCPDTALILPVYPENKQHQMINLGSTWQEGTTAASRYNSSCWNHLAFSRARRATLLHQGPVYVWLPGPWRSQSSTPIPHSHVFWGTGGLQPSLQCWAHLA